MVDSRFRVLITGIWMTALFWPYAHAGGYVAAGFLGLTPFILALGDLWPGWALKWGTWVIAVVVELYVQWSKLPGPNEFFRSMLKSIIALHQIAPTEWNQMSAHLATPLILIGACLGWAVYRQATTRSRVLTLFGVGIIALALNHVLWGLPAEGPLVVYLGTGLLLLLWFQVFLTEQGNPTFLPHRLWYGLAFVSIVVPLAVGWTTPARPGHGYLTIGFGHPSLSGGFGKGIATTGFADGINHIGQSLTPNYQPVLLVTSPSPHYWQGEIYNKFNGTTWTNPVSQAPYTITNDTSDLPLFPMPFSNSISVSTQQFRFTSLVPGGLSTLFYSGVPIMLSSPSPVTVFPSHEKIVGSNIATYSVTALVPSYNYHTIASTPYPLVTGMPEDLQTPKNLSPRVKALAEKITRNTDTPWQAVLAIKHYLDTHYKYSYHVTSTRTDVVNHFLFKDPQGYCDQFSTSFIMMLRTLGIPARWVVGYGPGTYSSSKNAYVIRSVDAHSWAQVYIAPDGWIPIDPTPGWSIPQLTVGTQTSVKEQVTVPIQPKNPVVPPGKLHFKGPNNTSPIKPTHVTGPTHSSHPIIRLWPWIAGVLALGAGLVILAPRRWLGRRATPRQLWRELRFWLWLHHRISPKFIQTPREFLGYWVRLYPDPAQPLLELIRLMEKGLYGPEDLSEEELQLWQDLWSQLRKHRKRRPFSRPA